MTSEKLIELIREPEKADNSDLDKIYQLLCRYPYFQSVRILYLKTLYLKVESRFRQELKTGTIHITDHKHFLRYLKQKIPFENDLPLPQEQQPILQEEKITQHILEEENTILLLK